MESPHEYQSSPQSGGHTPCLVPSLKPTAYLGHALKAHHIGMLHGSRSSFSLPESSMSPCPHLGIPDAWRSPGRQIGFGFPPALWGLGHLWPVDHSNKNEPHHGTSTHVLGSDRSRHPVKTSWGMRGDAGHLDTQTCLRRHPTPTPPAAILGPEPGALGETSLKPL